MRAGFQHSTLGGLLLDTMFFMAWQHPLFARIHIKRVAMLALSCLLLAAAPASSNDEKGTQAAAKIMPALSIDTNDAMGAMGAEPESNDLDIIKKRGTLRIIVPVNFDGGQYLPRTGSPVTEQLQIAKNFSTSLGLTTEIVPILGMQNILNALLTGKGDLIAANITVTKKRKEKMSFSVPIEHVQEVVLVKADADLIKKPGDLAHKSLLISPLTSFWESAQLLKSKHSAIQVVEQKAFLHDEDGLDLIAEGAYDATIRDSNIANMYLAFRDDLKIAFTLKGDKTIAWGLRPESTQLKQALDQYLGKIKLSTLQDENQFGDLADIKKRGVLRILLKNNSSSYFFWKGFLMGFEYELATDYAKHLGVKLAAVVAPENALTLEWLNAGKADLAAGFLTPTAEWSEQLISASIPYHKTTHHVVVQKENAHFNTIADLAGNTIVVQKSSIYWTVLEGYQRSGIKLTLVAAPENLETEEILEKVAEGEYESTLVDEHLLNIELSAGAAVRSAFTFDKEYEHVLAVREESTDLLTNLNAYIKKNKKGKLHRRLYRKYFHNPDTITRMQQDRLQVSGGKKILSPYDALVKTYAEQYAFDWRLITAQMHTESRFEPDRISAAGAIGLMQVLPKTAQQLELEAIDDPETNIHAGIKYLRWLSQRFEDELPVADRMWFSLAAYNAGIGHLQDARRLAAKEGLNKSRWFNHVEKAMLMLSKKRYYRKARYGYVRGKEPVAYVRRIKNLYENYLNVVETREESVCP